LPRAHEEVDPSFFHHGRAALPLLSDTGCQVRLIAGSLGGTRAPVEAYSEMFYADVTLEPGARFQVPIDHVERAAYPVQGEITVERSGGRAFGSGGLIVFAPGEEIVIAASGGPARVMLFGGEPMDGPRHLWWNFVSSSAERLEQAKADWKAGRFGPVPGETEFIPLPEPPPRPVNYP